MFEYPVPLGIRTNAGHLHVLNKVFASENKKISQSCTFLFGTSIWAWRSLVHCRFFHSVTDTSDDASPEVAKSYRATRKYGMSQSNLMLVAQMLAQM